MVKTNFLVYNRIMIEYKETQHTLMYKSNSDLSLYSAGYERCEPGHNFGPSIRSYQLIHFVLDGKGEFRIDEHIYSLKAGDAFLIPAGKVAYYEASKTNPWTYAWVNFLGINSETYFHQLITNTEDVYVIHNLDNEKYARSIHDILKLNHEQTSHFFEGNSILLHIISMLFEDIHFQEKNWDRVSPIDEIKLYLDVNYAENIKLLDLASSFGLHQNYLTRSFHEKFGISPKKYLMNLKLKKASQLLTTTELPISIISSSLGFIDQLAFSRTFKKHFGMSPSYYRKKHDAT